MDANVDVDITFLKTCGHGHDPYNPQIRVSTALWFGPQVQDQIIALSIKCSLSENAINKVG